MATTASPTPNYEYNPKWTDYQAYVRDALESGDNDLVVFRTGYGGGKSITGCQWIHRGALELDHGESLVMGQDFQKAEATTFKVFFETLPGENTAPNDAQGDPENSPIVAGYNENKKRLTYVTGHVARLGSADKWSRYAGGEFNRIYCDEVAHYDTTNLYDLHEMLSSRQRTDAGPNTMLWTSTGNGYNQFYDITERHVDADGNLLPWADSMKVIVVSTKHNNLMPDDARNRLIRQFKGTPREEQALHGGFAAAQGLVYPTFSRNTHVIPHEKADELATDNALYGYDHGWGDPRVVIDARKTTYNQYLVYDLFYRSESKYQAAVAWLQRNEKPRGTIYAEHEPEHQEAFKQAGYPVEPAIKDLDEGIPAVRDRLDTDDDSGRPGILISERCTEAIQEFLSYKEEHVGKSVAQDHFLDSLRYLIMGDNYSEESDEAFLITR